MFKAEAYIGIGCEMHDAGRAAHRLRQRLRIEKIAFGEREVLCCWAAAMNSRMPVLKLS
jgi:hypothetical protein